LYKTTFARIILTFSGEAIVHRKRRLNSTSIHAIARTECSRSIATLDHDAALLIMSMTVTNQMKGGRAAACPERQQRSRRGLTVRS